MQRSQTDCWIHHYRQSLTRFYLVNSVNWRNSLYIAHSPPNFLPLFIPQPGSKLIESQFAKVNSRQSFIIYHKPVHKYSLLVPFCYLIYQLFFSHCIVMPYNDYITLNIVPIPKESVTYGIVLHVCLKRCKYKIWFSL